LAGTGALESNGYGRDYGWDWGYDYGGPLNASYAGRLAKHHQVLDSRETAFCWPLCHRATTNRRTMVKTRELSHKILRIWQAD